MRAVVQRVKSASVFVEGEVVGAIDRGLLVFLGIGAEDKESLLAPFAEKIVSLRIFPDETGKMARSVRDVSGDVLVVSQFTLYGDCRKGRRPNFSRAAPPKEAEELYTGFITYLQRIGLRVQSGRFGAMMEVDLVNDGPVTILLDTDGGG